MKLYRPSAKIFKALLVAGVVLCCGRAAATDVDTPGSDIPDDLAVVSIPNELAFVVTLALIVETGSDSTGSLLRDAVTKLPTTLCRPAGQYYDMLVGDLGGAVTSGTDQRFAHVTVTVPGETASTALQVISVMLQNLSSEFEITADQVCIFLSGPKAVLGRITAREPLSYTTTICGAYDLTVSPQRYVDAGMADIAGVVAAAQSGDSVTALQPRDIPVSSMLRRDTLDFAIPDDSAISVIWDVLTRTREVCPAKSRDQSPDSLPEVSEPFPQSHEAVLWRHLYAIDDEVYDTSFARASCLESLTLELLATRITKRMRRTRDFDITVEVSLDSRGDSTFYQLVATGGDIPSEAVTDAFAPTLDLELDKLMLDGPDDTELIAARQRLAGAYLRDLPGRHMMTRTVDRLLIENANEDVVSIFWSCRDVEAAATFHDIRRTAARLQNR